MGEQIRRLPLDPARRQELEGLLRKAKTPQSLAMRIRIVLMTAEGLGANAIAERLATTRTTIRKWKARFVREGLDGLKDVKRPGAPSKHKVEEREKVLAAACGLAPEGRASIRSIARALQIDRGFVERVLYAERAVRRGA